VLPVSIATAAAKDMESSEQTQKAPRRRKCKNHLVQLAELFPDVVYHVAAVYGLPEDQIYVVEVYVEGQVLILLLLLRHMRTAINHPAPDRVKPPFVIFDIWAL